jgi:hypothetical protein
MTVTVKKLPLFYPPPVYSPSTIVYTTPPAEIINHYTTTPTIIERVISNLETMDTSNFVTKDFLRRQADATADSAGRSISSVSADLSALTTSSVTEGTNLYFTDARVGSYISASTTIPHIGGTLFGDMLQWSGTAWTTVATSSLGLSSGSSQWTTSGSNIYYNSGNVGIGTTSPYAKLSVVGSGSFDDHVRASYFIATSSTASIFNYASTTALSATTICLTTDCRTSWPSAGGGAYPFTPTTNYGVNNQATTGIAWFQNGLNASSTSNFVYASTSVLTVSGNSYLGTISSGVWNGTAIGVAYGGTGQTSFGQGWLHSDGTTFTSSTSPTVNYIVATSTRASIFPYASTTALTVSELKELLGGSI